MNSLQKKLLEMFVWFHDFCHKHKLTYYAVGGTMLGAVRHQGFIPWDDDIDVAMPREDYQRAIELLKAPIDHYVIEGPHGVAKDYVYSFAKLYDVATTMTERVSPPVKRGVYIDIFPLDAIGNSLDESIENYKKIDRVHMLLAMRVCVYRKDRKWWKNAAAFLGKLLPINKKSLAQKVDRLCSSRNYHDCQYVGILMGTYRAREIMRKEIYGTPTAYSFEGHTIYGPEKYDEYLTVLYKNWKQLPPEEKRHSAHDLIDLDLNKPYLSNYKNDI